jgi:hypothetical protein
MQCGHQQLAARKPRIVGHILERVGMRRSINRPTRASVWFHSLRRPAANSAPNAPTLSTRFRVWKCAFLPTVQQIKPLDASIDPIYLLLGQILDRAWQVVELSSVRNP